MNTTPENEFTELRRLLALKRHEQPPPRYFQDFSANVITALRTEGRSRRRLELNEEVPAWILRLQEWLQARPAFASAFGVVACAALIGGILVSEKDASAPVPMPTLLSEVAPVDTQPTLTAEPLGTPFQPVGEQFAPLLAGTNGQSLSRPSLFDIVPGLEMAPVADFR